jgi:hypothetical protein
MATIDIETRDGGIALIISDNTGRETVIMPRETARNIGARLYSAANKGEENDSNTNAASDRRG